MEVEFIVLKFAGGEDNKIILGAVD